MRSRCGRCFSPIQASSRWSGSGSLWRPYRGAASWLLADDTAKLILSERVGAPQVLPELTARIHIRYRVDVLPSWRVLYDGKEWGISGVAEVGRREGLELFVAAVG